MSEKREGHREARFGRVKQYVVGLGLGALSALYGVHGLLTRRAFLPGLKGGHSTLEGRLGLELAAAYLVGGLYLILRFFVHRRCRSESSRAQVYMVENVLLVMFIAVLVYVLLRVGSAGD